VNNRSFETMPIEELWALHDEIATLLTAKITAEKLELERRLTLLQGNYVAGGRQSRAQRRPYPQVFPKYRNPEEPAETWSGRGKQPRWVALQLKAGKKLDDLAIA
jgi:DNA-binding protein H-NS